VSIVFEKFIYNRLYDFFDKYNILFAFQYGFRKHLSKGYANLELIDSIEMFVVIFIRNNDGKIS